MCGFLEVEDHPFVRGGLVQSARNYSGQCGTAAELHSYVRCVQRTIVCSLAMVVMQRQSPVIEVRREHPNETDEVVGSQRRNGHNASELSRHSEYKYKDKKDWAVKFQQKNMNYLCKGSKKHNWSASTIGRLRYQGRTLWARVYASPRSANCGPH